jgi:hypothetical protein
MANGFNFSMREGGLVAVQPSDLSDVLLVIGSALEGPDGIVLPVSSVEDAIRTFGPVTFDSNYPPVSGASLGDFSGNTLVRDIETAFNAGCNRILAVRVGGAYATATISTLSGSPVPAEWQNRAVLRARGLFKGAQYNGARITLNANNSGAVSVSIHQSSARGGNLTAIEGTAPLPANTNLRALIDLVNSHPRNLSLMLEINTSALPSGMTVENALDLPLSYFVSANGSVQGQLTGGRYGVRQEYANSPSYKDIYTALTDQTNGIFYTIDGVEADYVLLSALYADDAVKDDAGTVDPGVSVLTEFGRFIHRLSATYPCHGIIGCQPLVASSAAELRRLVQTAYLPGADANTSKGLADVKNKRIRFGYFLTFGADAEGVATGVDFGRNVSVVAGIPAILSNSALKRYVDTAHAAYAGMLTLLAPQEIAAFRRPSGIVSLTGLKLQRDLLDTISIGIPYADGVGGALVVIERNTALSNEVMVINDATAAKRNSVFSYLSNVRIANIVTRNVRQALRPFLGKPNTADTITAMGTVVRGVLDRLAEVQALLGGEGIGYNFSIVPAGTGLQMTQVRVLIELRPAAFIRSISIEVTVRP